MELNYWYVTAAVVVVLLIYIAKVYNSLVQFFNRAKNGFAQIDVQLKRRYDLIPNLIEVAKEYMAHERETLEAVVSARNEAAGLLQQLEGDLTNRTAAAALGGAEAQLGAALGNFRVAVEAYPDLKASANMTQLSEELTSTENKISFARQAYNDAVNEYNTYRQSFPPIVFAGMFNYNDMSFLNFDDEREQLDKAPTVKF